MSKIMALGFFGLCVYVAIFFEVVADGMLLASSSWFILPFLVVLEGVVTMVGIVKGFRSILEI